MDGAVRFVTTTLQGVGTRWVDKRLLINQVATLVRFLFWLFGLGTAVALSVNLKREVLLAIGGTAAVTIGFALKDLAASVLAGVIIIIDRPFQVGDRVTFGGVYREIASIGLRSVRLVTLDDNVITIPNNKLLTEIVSSGNWGALDMMIQMDFFVGIDQDVILADALTSCRFVYTKKPWVVLVNQVLHAGVMALRLRAKAYVLDVQYEKAFETDVTKRVLAAFREQRHPAARDLASQLERSRRRGPKRVESRHGNQGRAVPRAGREVGAEKGEVPPQTAPRFPGRYVATGDQRDGSQSGNGRERRPQSQEEGARRRGARKLARSPVAQVDETIERPRQANEQPGAPRHAQGVVAKDARTQGRGATALRAPPRRHVFHHR
jgi:hypothetical protein